ncbi:TetR/AcrR family transcriptional regulator [Mycolicibacterium sediminis]|uniref:HTH tetR-type domain-containing protein n=1 Tax=Mycolicibacterium sediminis TaxID=1286180 RepID=A0A7I7QSR4_9MYCO|nr:TetR/AcrR family transcriptional regulator [Mycolicibacterium sediminis]BBY29100.1 hypothetical protein MSEDJ_31960 [Mycolicibacterium sediminis]
MPSPAKGLTQPERVELSARRLVEAAAALIVEKGWETTTAAEIGRRAGYSRAMVHARYGSKDAILDTLFRDAYDARANTAPAGDADGLSVALRHVDRIVDLYLADPVFTRALFVLAFEAVPATSALRSRMQAWLAGGADTVEAGLRAGIVDGSVRADVDVAAATLDVSTAGLGIVHRWMLFGDEPPLDAGLTALRDRIRRDYGAPAR